MTKKHLPPLGVHVSVAGGMPNAIERATALGCTAAQVFVKNANQWQGRELTEEEVERFRAARAGSGVGPLVAHASYLINLCSADPALLARSRQALADELSRCARLGVDGRRAHRLGLDQVFQMGGAQAIAAFAYGTKTVPRADRIVGPGNIYVAAAKRLLGCLAAGLVLAVMIGPQEGVQNVVAIVRGGFPIRNVDPSRINAIDRVKDIPYGRLGRATESDNPQVRLERHQPAR